MGEIPSSRCKAVVGTDLGISNALSKNDNCDFHVLSTLGIRYGGGNNQLFSDFQETEKLSIVSAPGFLHWLQKQGICQVLNELNLSTVCELHIMSSAAKMSGLSK